jgi:hypothetical protein
VLENNAELLADRRRDRGPQRRPRRVADGPECSGRRGGPCRCRGGDRLDRRRRCGGRCRDRARTAPKRSHASCPPRSWRGRNAQDRDAQDRDAQDRDPGTGTGPADGNHRRLEGRT